MQTVFIAKVNNFVVESPWTTRVREVASVRFYLVTRYSAGSTSRNRAGPSLRRGIALSIDDNYHPGDAERCNFTKLVRSRAIVYKVIPERSIASACERRTRSCLFRCITGYSVSSRRNHSYRGYRFAKSIGEIYLIAYSVSRLNSSVIRKARCRGSARDA